MQISSYQNAEDSPLNEEVKSPSYNWRIFAVTAVVGALMLVAYNSNSKLIDLRQTMSNFRSEMGKTHSLIVSPSSVICLSV